MKVLFLPQNIASIPAMTTYGLNKIEGVDARFITFEGHLFHQTNSFNIVIKRVSRRNPFKWIINRVKLKREIKKWIDWADVVHYIWGPTFADGSDVKYAFKKGKALFIEWVGSDIRKPEYLMSINPYFKEAWDNGYEYKQAESEKQSKKNQEIFIKYGAIPIESPEMRMFLEPVLTEKAVTVLQRFNVNDYSASFPDINVKKPLIIHMPTSIVGKGTNYIVPVMEALKKEYDFDFLMLQNISHEEALQYVNKCDVFLDQIICGGHGIASIEALSLGKPVIAYLLPQLYELGLPKECPILSANPDTLKEVLIPLITNAALRHEIGVKSRLYAEKYHESTKVAIQLNEIYSKSLIKQNA